MHHTLHASRANLHGRFSADAAPALTVESGDVVSIFSIPDVSWGLEPPTSTTAPRRKVEPRDPVADNGPCMCGPIAVRNAAPGDTLEIHIEQITPGPWGWTYAGKGTSSPALNKGFGVDDQPLTLLRWQIDRARGVASDQHDHRVALRPFPGTIGLASAALNENAWPPRATGGNMDCREFIAGTTLYLPVMTAGGLLSIGDGHAAQGDGELAGTAIESPIEEARLRLTLLRDMPITSPRAKTAEGWITFGFAANLDAAAEAATSAMLDLMIQELGVSRAEALALASAQVSLRITQMVNPLRGVHALWTR